FYVVINCCLSFTLLACSSSCLFSFFFFNDTATTEIYTLSLHDALPIFLQTEVADPGLRERARLPLSLGRLVAADMDPASGEQGQDRKSTRLNSSHLVISYAVFCLKKKKQNNRHLFNYTNKILTTKPYQL